MRELESLVAAAKKYGRLHTPSDYQVAYNAFMAGAEWAIKQSLELMDTCLFLDENWSLTFFRNRFEEYLKQ